MKNENRPQEVAIARFAIIAPLVSRQRPPDETAAIKAAIFAVAHPFPAGPTTVSRRTLNRWVAAYNAALPRGTVAALSALAPEERNDKGKPRVFDEELLVEAIRLREELDTRSTADLLAHFKGAPKEATLAYHLRQRGVTRKAVRARGRAYPRYEAKAPNTTWQSDVKDGFWLPDPTNPSVRREAHLMGFIDDHSRLVLHGEWYFKESLPCLFDCLKKAVIKHGIPETCYWDNGPIYKSKQVSLVAARLGCKVVFSTPYCPEGKGKIERYWLTVSEGFMKEAAHAELQTLEELNQHFWAWLELYHARVHGSTRQTPLARWGAGAASIRRPHPADLPEIFLWEETRLVHKTGTLSLGGNEYRVNDSLVGDKVEVRYDPLDLAVVRVYRDGAFLEVAEPARLSHHTHRKATPDPRDIQYLPLPSSKRLLAARALARRTEVEAFLSQLGPSPTEPSRAPAAEDAGVSRADVDTFFDHLEIPPRPPRLTGPEWLALLETVLARPLQPPERNTATDFFRRHAPLQTAPISEALRTVVGCRGAERHLSFYLSEVFVATRGGRS